MEFKSQESLNHIGCGKGFQNVCKSCDHALIAVAKNTSELRGFIILLPLIP